MGNSKVRLRQGSSSGVRQVTTRTTSEAKLLARAAEIAECDITSEYEPWEYDSFCMACINWLDAHAVDSHHELVRKRGSPWVVSWRKGSLVYRNLHIALAKAVIAVSKEEKSHA